MRRSSNLRRALRILVRSPQALAGLVIIVAVVVAAALAPQLAPHDPINDQVLANRFLPPAWQQGGNPAFPLGTDQLGRDILSRIIFGARISLMVGLLSVLISGVLGTVAGLLGGFYGGWLDNVLMRLADVQLAFPYILLAITVMFVLGPSLWNIILVLGITGWVNYARVVRSETLALRDAQFVEAAHAIGRRPLEIAFRHVLPNVIPSLIVMATLQVAQVIVVESSLTFLGLGVDPRIPSWGGMLADARQYINVYWWAATFPGVAIMLTVLGINFVGDWMRDTFDPRLRA